MAEQPKVLPLDAVQPGARVRVQGGRNFDKFHGGMEGEVLINDVENKKMTITFDEQAEGEEPVSVAYRHLEHAPTRGGYRAATRPAATPAAKAPEHTPTGPLVEEHGGRKTAQLVQIAGLQGAPELNGKLGRLRKFDEGAGRWECDVRGAGIKRLKPDNITDPEKPVVPKGLSVEEYKKLGNDAFKEKLLEKAIAFYSAAIKLSEDECEEDLEQEVAERVVEEDGPIIQDFAGAAAPVIGSTKRHEQADAYGLKANERRVYDVPPVRQALAVLYGNRCQCHIMLARESQDGKELGKETRAAAMRANMDAAQAIELDPTNGKAYYRRGCAMLGMAPSASRAKEAIGNLEIAITGRASGGKTGIVLPNQMRDEVNGLLDYSKKRFDSCTEAYLPDPEEARENCRQQ